jgi:GNAT superfamily N-acetyltransferase
VAVAKVNVDEDPGRAATILTAPSRARTMERAAEVVPRPDSGKVVALRNGAAVRLRPIRPDDAAGLIALCSRLSPQTTFQRFFTVRPLRPEDAAALAHVDGRQGVAIVAERDVEQRNDLVGVARYGLTGDDPAPDVGLVVEDAWQGLGLGSILLNELLRAGEARGLVTFRADVLAENRRMLRLLARYADIVHRTADHGVITILFRRLPDSLGPSTRAHSSSSESPPDCHQFGQSTPAQVR